MAEIEYLAGFASSHTVKTFENLARKLFFVVFMIVARESFGQSVDLLQHVQEGCNFAAISCCKASI